MPTRWPTSACSRTRTASPRCGRGAARSRARRGRPHPEGEVDLVVQRDAVIAHRRDLGLALPGPVHGTGPQLGQPEAAALVEPERVDVVVGGGEPDLAAPAAARLADGGLDEQRADAGPALDGVERDDLQHVAENLV